MGVARSQTVEDGAPRRDARRDTSGSDVRLEFPVRDETALVDYDRRLIVRLKVGGRVTLSLERVRVE